MKVDDHTCPKCKAPMEPGHIQDAAWMSVAPDAGAWERAKRTFAVKGIQGQRCTKCGFLELYVLPQ
jgi:hypothetical protein